MNKNKLILSSIENELKNHVGIENGISIDELLSFAFPNKINLILKGKSRTMLEKFEYNELVKFLKDRILRKLRKNPKTFSISANVGGTWVYFLIKNRFEADVFHERMVTVVNGIKKTTTRAYESIQYNRQKERVLITTRVKRKRKALING